MKLSEMKLFLADRSIVLTKSLGQNFLHDVHQLQRIVAAAELTKTERVLEVGPGLGPLTEHLLAAAGEVLAIEKDRRLFDVLAKRFAGTGHLTLLCDDALAWLRRESRDWTGWKLVANLPYSVASPILVELAQAPRGPDRLVATLQLEVARRLLARANDDDYGILSLLVQLHYEPGALFRIPPECFFPAPNVDSACVTLVRRTQALLPPEETVHFTRLVKLAFSQRRKMMLKLLKQQWPTERLTSAFAEVGLSVQTRAEAVNLDEFVRLLQLLRHA